MIRNTLKKAAGLFFEFEEQPPTEGQIVATEPWKVMDQPAKASPKTIEQIVQSQPGPNLDEIKVDAQLAAPTTPAEPVLRPDGSVNFGAIYSLAKLPVVPFTAEQILELFATLPPDLPLASKRGTIRVTLGAMAKTMGVSTEQIVTDASRKLAALAAYNDSFEKQAGEFVSKAELDILGLEQQIEERRRSISEAKTKQETMNTSCAAEADRLDDVLEFFSLDVPPSKHAV